MKKIALISAATVLALGAAAIAADTDGLPRLAALDGSNSTASLTAITVGKTARLDAEPVAARRPDRQHGPQIRVVSPDRMRASSCATANWPYYPPECLKQAEPLKQTQTASL
ncbi:hypothetical protein [Hoeflea olei]|uniref:Uncharacterized protein n=1 Tax=Hoeflea olei TaxID=1480615 RepID=A0A1C1YUS6_9HYPH|nr:hypothetical protein [Hoeflea olei]OCW57146.1 hypothetical protein AWJ14_08395 [Hoeflea olei]